MSAVLVQTEKKTERKRSIGRLKERAMRGSKRRKGGEGSGCKREENEFLEERE
jgi:hypothetical protein